MNQSIQSQMEALCGAVDGTAGLYLSVPAAGVRLSLGGTQQLPSASTIKLPMLALLLADAESGRVDLEQPLPISPENRVGGAGILQSLHPELRLPLGDYAELMMVLSDNIATNVVMDVLGMERVNDFCRRQGLRCTHLGRKMMSKGPLQPDGSFGENYTCAQDLGLLLERLWVRELVSPRASETMLQILAGQRKGKFLGGLPQAIQEPDPRKPLPVPQGDQVLVLSKGGTLSGPGILHDAGIFVLPQGKAGILVLTTRSANTPATLSLFHQAARTFADYLRTT